ncbi:hypothetical protein [Streptomyces sp. NPDC002889]|uniref:hypothetical protein n=1 Tax=Streptomyces sp. NPDC002889 TaxID=3364669 RepID=UPI00367D91F0
MGDRFRTIVDLDATAEDAEALAERALAWLVAEGIVLAEQTHCVFGQPVRPPGPHWARTAAPEDSDGNPSDGLAVTTGRTVFHGGQDQAEWADCPGCGGRTLFGPGGEEQDDPWADDALSHGDGDAADAGDEEWQLFSAAVGAWHATGEGYVECRHCAVDVPVTDWIWQPGCFALGHLGLEFWNWPEFRPEFVAELGRQLGGHRTVVVWGKL